MLVSKSLVGSIVIWAVPDPETGSPTSSAVAGIVSTTESSDL